MERIGETTCNLGTVCSLKIAHIGTHENKHNIHVNSKTCGRNNGNRNLQCVEVSLRRNFQQTSKTSTLQSST